MLQTSIQVFTTKKEPMIWDKIEQFLKLIPEEYSDPHKQSRFERSFGSSSRLWSEYRELRRRLAECSSPLVFAHNDLLLGNVVHDERAGAVAFIDYEYAGYNYQAFDIANHFNEYVGLSLDDIDYSRYPCEEFQRRWVHTYLSEFEAREVGEEQVSRVCDEVRRLAPLSHFLWAVWALVQYHLSDIHFDFLRYAEIRLGRYYELKEERDAP
ncbi:ethanolamine kinase isoform X2 [Danaus plexippus]|uniref:ethanolamine kinase isoform X2 n=1 Tax=Danaus plexippus TaxID=13037 RepID=UPI002AB21229|nr:ethanolamine kinase isoform X2 [Danaus plexippus]